MNDPINKWKVIRSLCFEPLSIEISKHWLIEKYIIIRVQFLKGKKGARMIRESDFQDVTAINEGILLRIGGEEDRSSDR